VRTATVTFLDLPLHTGEYVVSAICSIPTHRRYDEWFKYLHFKWVSPSLLPGLVNLRHDWS
jgi:lipopolysaccharide transport system ATP-binding protein